MFYVSRNLAAFYNLRKNSAKPDIGRNFCSASRIFQKIGLGVYREGRGNKLIFTSTFLQLASRIGHDTES